MLQGQLHNENDEDLDEEDEDEDEDHAMELDSDMVRFFLVSNNLYSYIQKICKQCKAKFKLDQQHAILFCRIVMMRKKTDDLRYSDEKKKKKEEMNRTNIAVDLEVNQIERTKKTI